MTNVFLVTRAVLIFSTALTFMDSNLQCANAASTSEILKTEDALESSFVKRTLAAVKHRVLTHAQAPSDENVTPNTDQDRTFFLADEDKLFLEKLKDQKYVADFLKTSDAKIRQCNLALSILGTSEEDLFTYDETGEIDWISAIGKARDIPLESLNLDAARLLVSDFLVHNENFDLPIFSVIFGKLFHAAQRIEEGILPKDDIELCLLTCHRRNLNIHTHYVE